jgi:hypothetical protein
MKILFDYTQKGICQPCLWHVQHLNWTQACQQQPFNQGFMNNSSINTNQIQLKQFQFHISFHVIVVYTVLGM